MSSLLSQHVFHLSLFGVCTMKLLGIGSELSGGKVTRILKNLVEISYQDGTIEFISFDEAERRVWVRV